MQYKLKDISTTQTQIVLFMGIFKYEYLIIF